MCTHHLSAEGHFSLQVREVREVTVILKHGGHMNTVDHACTQGCQDIHMHVNRHHKGDNYKPKVYFVYL